MVKKNCQIATVKDRNHRRKYIELPLIKKQKITLFFTVMISRKHTILL